MKRMIRAISSLAAVALIAAGCSASGNDVETDPREAAMDPAESIEFEVENDLFPSQSVIVTFHAAGETERSLGTVLARQTETFTVENRHSIPPYYLVAEGSGGKTVVSREINEANADEIEWSLATNSLRVEF